MQRFSALARWVATVIFIPFLIGVVTLAGQTWLRGAVLALGCFVAGLWLDWLLRKLDDTRADKRKALGTEMLNLGNKPR
jgi:hypothetical protein